MSARRASVLFGILAVSMMAFPVAAAEKVEDSVGQGTVVFYRTRSAKGGAIRLRITGGDDGTVGSLSNGSKIVKVMPVGTFTFTVNSPSIAGTDSVTINVQAGKTYYVKGVARLGWPAARPQFTLMDEAKGKSEADKIK